MKGTISTSKSHLPALLLPTNTTSKSTRHPTRNRLGTHKVHQDLTAIQHCSMSSIERRGEILLVHKLHKPIASRAATHYPLLECIKITYIANKVDTLESPIARKELLKPLFCCAVPASYPTQIPYFSRPTNKVLYGLHEISGSLLLSTINHSTKNHSTVETVSSLQTAIMRPNVCPIHTSVPNRVILFMVPGIITIKLRYQNPLSCLWKPLIYSTMSTTTTSVTTLLVL